MYFFLDILVFAYIYAAVFLQVYFNFHSKKMCKKGKMKNEKYNILSNILKRQEWQIKQREID